MMSMSGRTLLSIYIFSAVQCVILYQYYIIIKLLFIILW